MNEAEKLAEAWADDAEVEERRAQIEAFCAGYAAAAPKWVSCEERLPEKEKEVLVHGDVGAGAFISMGALRAWMQDPELPAWREQSELIWVSDPYWWELKHITHWMPLPEPPKGEK